MELLQLMDSHAELHDMFYRSQNNDGSVGDDDDNDGNDAAWQF